MFHGALTRFMELIYFSLATFPVSWHVLRWPAILSLYTITANVPRYKPDYSGMYSYIIYFVVQSGL